MQLREPSYSELPRIATLLRKAFWADDIFGNLMHPHRAQYPQDYELWFLQGLRSAFWNARSRMLVAITENTNHMQPQVIVGFAQWNRVGPGGKALPAKAHNLGTWKTMRT